MAEPIDVKQKVKIFETKQIMEMKPKQVVDSPKAKYVNEWKTMSCQPQSQKDTETKTIF